MAELLDVSKPDLYIGTRRGLYGLLLTQGEAEPQPLGLWNQPVTAVLVDARGQLKAVGTASSGLYHRTRGSALEAVEGWSANSVPVLGSDPDGGWVYAACDPPAIFRSSDGGRRWEEVVAFHGPWLESGGSEAARVTALLAADGALYVGLAGAGVLRSADTGRTFVPLAEGLPRSVLCLAAHAQASQIIYAGTEAGLYRSDKAGHGWQRLTHDDARPSVTSVATCPSDQASLLAGAARRNRLAKPATPAGADAHIYRSQDRGESFQELDPARVPVIRGHLTTILFHPGAPERVFASTSTGEVFASHDSGRCWRMIASTLPGVLAMAAGPGLH